MSDGAAEAAKRWNPLRSLYTWIMSHAEGPNAPWVLAALSFAESSFFPMPPDIVMIPMIMADRSRALRLVLWTAMWSVIGGAFGYLIGSLLFNFVGHWLIPMYWIGGELARFPAPCHK